MGPIATQITSLTIVYSTVLFRHRSKKTSKLRVTGLCVGNSPGTGEFPAQMASNAENVSIWWRHHVVAEGLTTQEGQSVSHGIGLYLSHNILVSEQVINSNFSVTHKCSFHEMMTTLHLWVFDLNIATKCQRHMLAQIGIIQGHYLFPVI